MALVIKYGGNAMIDPAARRSVAAAIRGLAEAGHEPVVVHGGGPVIKEALERAKLPVNFIRGLRVTTAESLPIIEAALSQLNKVLSQDIGQAIGLTGRDMGLIRAERFDEALGFVGSVSKVNAGLLKDLLGLELIPVIACLAENETGDGVLNVNADEVAGAVAGALGAPVLFLTNVVGVLGDPQNPASLLQELSKAQIETRIRDGRLSGGMIPKVEAALYALERGAPYARIIDGRDASVLQRAVHEALGTKIVP